MPSWSPCSFYLSKLYLIIHSCELENRFMV
uniref:Uncharacterized protein n=1 Tax=Arundo donax TaxID=35708 RepID=A0A0A8ZLT7_ARUDO